MEPFVRLYTERYEHDREFSAAELVANAYSLVSELLAELEETGADIGADETTIALALLSGRGGRDLASPAGVRARRDAALLASYYRED